jgi:hypothetical protein
MKTATRFFTLQLLALLLVVTLSAQEKKVVATTNASRAVPKDQVKPFEAPFVISGSARERGKTYGKHFRAGIHEFLNEEIYAAFVGKSATKEELFAYAEACAAVTRKSCPMVAEEIAGIAEGAGLQFNEVMLIQLHEELYHRAPLPQLGDHGHCTVAAVGPKDSSDKHAYLGQTWDWMTSVAGKSQLTEWRRGIGGLDVLAYGFPGMPFGAGMNEKGVAFCWTSAALRLKGKSPRIGVPSYALITHLLNQKKIESVISEAKRIQNAGWFTFVFNDAKGNIVNIEGSPAGVVVERSNERMVRADYGTPEKQAEMKAIFEWQPAARVPVLCNLLEGTAGQNGRATIQKYLENPKYKISTAGHPRNVSIDVMLFDTTAKKAYVTRGPEYGIEWREFGFGRK